MANKKPLTKEFTAEQRAIFALGRNERDMFISALRKSNRRAFDEFQYNEGRYQKECEEYAIKCAVLERRIEHQKNIIESMKAVNNECVARMAEALVNEPILSNLEGTCVPTGLLRQVVAYLEARGGYSKGLATKIKNNAKAVHKDIEKAVADLKNKQAEDLADRRELGLEE